MDDEELHEEIELTPEDEAALNQVNSDGELAFMQGIDTFNPLPFHLITKFGCERAIELLKDPKNRTPRMHVGPEGSGKPIR